MSRLKNLFRLGTTLCAFAALPWWGVAWQSGSGDEGVQVTVTQVDLSHFPQIKVYVSVTNAAGEPVAVAADSLVLSENGVAVKVDEISGQGQIGPLTTMLIMDVSGSMNQAGKLATAKAAARAYVEHMRTGDQAGLIAFNTESNYVQKVTSDRQALTQAIDRLRAENDTAMYDALAQGVQILAGLPGRKAIIVLTDGLDNRSRRTADEVVEQIGPSGLSISTIGLGDASQLGVSNAGLDEAALTSLAKRAGGTFGYANDPDSLRGLYERYGRTLQSEYVIIYTSPATLRDGVKRSLTVSLAEAAAPAQVAYNPGGVVPEVPRRASGAVFGLALVGLIVLLLMPALVRRGMALSSGNLPTADKLLTAVGLKKKESRIRLQDKSKTPSQPKIRMR